MIGDSVHDPGVDGATLLDAADLDDIVPSHVTTRRELNEWEQANILAALPWLARSRNIFTEHFVRTLHSRMFGETWKWAGHFRRTKTNIGAPWEQVPTLIQQLLSDVQYWIAHATYGHDEIGARFHHRLVSIHPFPNGNGRHARLMTDQLVRHLGDPPFTWGSESLDAAGTARSRYLEALRAADRGDCAALLAFVRT